jgi:hypothetical protein
LQMKIINAKLVQVGNFFRRSKWKRIGK